MIISRIYRFSRMYLSSICIKSVCYTKITWQVNSQRELKNYMYIHFVSLQPVPTDIWVEILTERLKLMDCVKKGYVLEGFPQTREQALALQSVGIHPKHCGIGIVSCMYTCIDLYKSWFVDITQSYTLLTISFEWLHIECVLNIDKIVFCYF